MLENEGKPGISDGMFISQFVSRYPAWRERPGATDLFALCDLARELKLASTVEAFRDYDHLLHEHRQGRSILVMTERVPEQTQAAPTFHRYEMLLEAMDEKSFALWCPYPSGQSDVLPRAARTWWDRWLATGIVLYRA